MIGIVLLNYNNWALTVECIKSIQATTVCEYKIYVVDNASSMKPSISELEYMNSFDNVSVIFNKNNKGYSAGNNVGIKCAVEEHCDNLLISNNDVIFSDGCIEGLNDYLNSNSDVAIVGPKVFLPSGKLQEINMGCKMTLKGKFCYLLRKTPLGFLTKDFVSKFHAEHQDMNKPFEVYGVSGCCFMISAAYVDLLCPLDEHTFLYEEENILANKVEQINKKVVYNCDYSIIHLGGESTKNISEFSYACQVESEIYYCGKCLNSNKLLLLFFVFIRTVLYLRYFGFRKYSDYYSKIKKMYKYILR